MANPADPGNPGGCGWISTRAPKAGRFHNWLGRGGVWPCSNDKANGFLIGYVRKETLIRFYDDPGRSTTDDWCEIYVKRDMDTQILIGSMEAQFDNDSMRMTFHKANDPHGNGLNGHVSAAEVQLNVPDLAKKKTR